MFIVRNVMHCKPGKAKEMVGRFKEFEQATKKLDNSLKTRVMTDVTGERFWTVVSEIETGNLEQFNTIMSKMQSDPSYNKTLGSYHDIVESGRREIYKLED